MNVLISYRDYCTREIYVHREASADAEEAASAYVKVLLRARKRLVFNFPTSSHLLQVSSLSRAQ